MSHSKDIDILVSEVGPRDGLQSIKQTMPTDMKKKWISALAQAGLTEIEVGSFVSPKLLPQMADCGELVKHSLTLKDVFVAALVPNLKGAENAFNAGVQKITIPVSVSEPHSLSNIHKNHAEVYEEVNSIIQLRNEKYPGILIEAGLSTVFGCTIQGVVTENEVLSMAHRMAKLGVDEIGLADTVGYANPVQVRSLFKKLKQEVGNLAGSAHFHNTRGQGLANVLAAIEVGVTTFDASQGGIGGCPYAPGASGNIVTEDLVYLLESMGLRTGIDIDRLVEAREWLKQGIPGEPLYGFIPDAGVGKNFKYAKDL
ncbi:MULTISPECIES: hydroxymethylglutaryl-CoA lyase [Acinetobacter]|jgi:hydroxymethylglutaryl-CoA lyase|uniref:Hydroxymethylglutaryl-CoA lyase n=1 Tax=Acinetobacter pittii TaxID=48296 RepID=A0A242U1G4_ACIPI|nr:MULTISPECIES: hydroxymethylglutaryl-CoA lyase [Acinetobacter]MBJ8471101.1 hydroxymethylglutaryl-CoA lyase [Acinetobacter pittii]MBJ8499786.1 hydroxymethylglutaryl-CoA lyase [Acinetobacter pittii]MBJ9893591.1 hydroxymethylglutaryl-CoA lyase [Acinetobacter pittii]MCU4477070.1 hydroxymethylglutaryl-CoA lyase [Acinetobacter sp. WU_MDCI_Abxd143]MDN4020601.1 hydroxymethylglutaryl-CoA lyase [Acinetobacter pittii]